MRDKRLTYLLAIINEGSFSKAAKRLYISQPALSQTVKGLEEELSCSILRRDTTPLSLTYEGELYCKTMLHLNEEYENFVRQIKDLSQPLCGNIALGISAMRAQQLLPQLLPVLRRELPGLNLRFVHGQNRRHLLELVRDGQVDFSISSGDRPHDLVTELLDRSEDLLIVPHAHPMSAKYGYEKDWRKKPPVHFCDFADDCFILKFPGQGGRVSSDRLMAQEGFVPKSFIEVFDYNTGIQLADAGLGVTVISESYVIPQYDRLKGCLFGFSAESTEEVFLSYKPTLYITALMQRFMDLCKSAPQWKRATEKD